MWQGDLGANLIQALATGKSWLADESKLRWLRQLALGPNVQQQVEGMLAGWEKKPWAISYYRLGDRQHFQVLQYETDSLNGVEEKLAQFAPGSNFTWAGTGRAASEEEKSVSREVAEFLADHGMKLSAPAN